MRSLVWVICIAISGSVAASDIQTAEQERARAKQALEQLKTNTELGQKRLNLIEREMTRLNQNTEALSRDIQSAEIRLTELKTEQSQTEAAIADQQNTVDRLVTLYQKELVAYYITGRTLRPDSPSDSLAADYLPFVLKARQNTAAALADEQNQLAELLSTQANQTRTAQMQLQQLTEKRSQLTTQIGDQRQLLASVSRELSSSQSRQAALQADLQALDQRIRSLKLNQRDADIEALRGRLNWPVDGRVIRRFGQRRDDGFGTWQGLVISAPTNAEVRAVQAGKVAYAGYLLGYGLVVVVAHNNGHATIYGHNARVLVSTGDPIAAQQAIAIAGNTGSLEISGLYFGVTKNGQAINPRPWLN